MKVFNFGSINLDYTYVVSDFVREGETISAVDKLYSVGGKGLNQSVALASAGVEVKHVGAVGATDHKRLLEYFALKGIDGTFVNSDQSKDTGNAIIQLKPDGANSIIVHGGANTNISDEHYSAAINEITQEDWVLLQNETNDVERLIPLLSATGATLVLNPSPFSADIRNWSLDLIDYLILNESELDGLFSSYASAGYVEAVVANYQKNGASLQNIAEDIVCAIEPIFGTYPELKMVITLGSAGSIYCTREELFIQPAIPANPVDTTGAGDTFTGYFMSEIIASGNIEQALLTASVAAAISIGRKGAAETIPKRAEVLKKLTDIDVGVRGL